MIADYHMFDSEEFAVNRAIEWMLPNAPSVRVILAERPIRWIVDDAAKFAAREVRRGKRYDGIILDPPKFGRGPEGEVWRLEDHLPGLVHDCAALLDVDHFKSFNDRYGHPAGDQCLQHVAQTLSKALGPVRGVLARWGGEEFVAVLPNTGASVAMQVADTLRSAAEGLNLRHDAAPLRFVSISVGVAALPELAAAFVRQDGVVSRRLERPDIRRPLGLVMRRNRSLSPAAGEMVRMLRSGFGRWTV